MNIQTLSLSKVAGTSVRATGFSSAQFKAATWRGDDLLVQMKNGEVLVLKGANAKRLSTPDFFLVFDDTSLPLASFAPGMDQPVANKAPHVPPFEVAAPVKVGKLPPGGQKAKGAAVTDEALADEAWADQALASTNASANTAAPDASVSTSSVPLADNASTASAASTTHTSADAAAAAPTTASLGSSLWGWPAVALGAGGAVALAQGGGSAAAADAAAKSAGTVSGVLVLGPVTNGKDLRVNVYDAKGNLLGSDAPNNDGSFTVSLDKAPATSVIRVVVAPVSGNTGSNDYIGEDGNTYDLLTPVSALTTFEAGKASTVNVTHYTDILARNLVEAKKTTTGAIELSATELKAASTAFAKALGVATDTPIEQLRPQPTVDANGNTTTNPDLYGQLLKTVFEQVKAAQDVLGETATTEQKVNAVAVTLNTLAQAITIDLPTSTATTASVSVEPDLGKVVLAAKVADYAAAVKADPSSTTAVAKAPSVDDFQAAGIPVTTPEAAKAVSAAAAVAVNTPPPPGAAAPALVETVANAATETVAAQNKAPTAVTLTTVLSEIAEITTGGKAPLTKVADIAVTDDGSGTNALTLAGADKDSFELQGNALYLKAGTTLDFEAKKTYAVKVQAADAAVTGSAPVSADFTLNVADGNDAPTAVTLTSVIEANQIAENTPVTTRLKVADIAVTDDGLGTNALTLSGADAAQFEIDGQTLYLKAGTTLDFEAKKTYAVTVQAADAAVTGSAPVSADFTLNVTDGNDAPTAVTLTSAIDGNQVAENTAVTERLKVADIAVTDDGLGTNALTLAGADAAHFEIDGQTLYLKAGTTLDFEAKKTYAVSVQAADAAVSGSAPVSTDFTLNVTDGNDAPTAVTLTSAIEGDQIAENTAVTERLKVADIAVTDDGLGTNALTLAGADAAHFEIDGRTLYLKDGTTLDFEAKKTYAVTVQAADAALTSSSPVSADFTLSVTDVNEAPTATGSVSPVTAFKDTPITEIDLSTQFSDVDVGDTRTYSLSTGSVLPDGLSLDTRTGKISGTPKATTSGTTSITVVATDTGGLTAEQTFSLTVNAINHAPTGTDGSVAAKEDSPYVLKAADFGFKDATGETGELLNVILTALPAQGSLLLDGTDVTLTDGKAVVSKADIDAGKLTFQAAPNANGEGYANLSFKVKDNGGTVGTGAADTSASANTLTFNVASVNDAPTGTDGSVAAKEDSPYVLKAADFGFKDAESETDVLLNVILTALPAQGSLKLNGTDVTLTDGKAVVSKADIDGGLLTFQAAPNANGNGYATLSFKVQDSGGTDNGGANTSASANTLTFNVAAVNDAPTAKGTVSAVAVTAGTAITDIDLSSKFEDVDTSDTLTYTVTGGTLPSGLSLTDGKITGTPDTPTSGTSHITVTATDSSDAKATQTFDLTVLRPVSVDKVAGDDVINLAERNASAALTGMAVAGSTVTITLPDGTTQRTTTADDTGAWTYTLTDDDYTALGQGTGKTVSVSSYDPVTKVTSPTVTHTFGIDTVVPEFVLPPIDHSGGWSMTRVWGMTTVNRVADLDLSTIKIEVGFEGFSYQLTGGSVLSTTPGAATLKFWCQKVHDYLARYLDVQVSDVENGIAVKVLKYYSQNSFNNMVEEHPIELVKALLHFQAEPIAGASPLALAMDSGGSASDLITTNGQVNVKALEAGATWKYKVDSADYQEGGSDKSFTVTGDGEHTVNVQQFDAVGNPSKVESLTFTLDTTPPTFTDGDTKTVSVAENTAIATAVLTASATDKDVAVTQYAFAGGDDDGKFDLDAATGKLTFKASSDFEAPSSKAGSNAYTVKIKAVDTAGNSAVQTITVNVTDVNEAPTPKGTVSDLTATKGEAITTLDLSSYFKDVDADDKLTYAVKEGASLPTGLVLDADTGKISGTPLAATHGASAITVVAKDKAEHTAEQTFNITVTATAPVAVLTQVSDDVGPVQGDVAALQVTRIASPAMTSIENRVTITPTVSGDMTVEGWFKTDAPISSTTQQLFHLGGMELQVIDGTLRTWASSGGNQTVSSFTVDNQWHHYALTTDGAGHWQVWVDGVVKQEREGGSIGATPAAQTIYVGGHASAASAGLRGAVGQVQVWDSQRTATEIAADMHDTYTGGKNSAGETPANLVGVWALAGNGDNQVSGGVSATLGRDTRSEAASIQFLFNYQTDDATPTLSGTLNVALGSGERLVLLDGDTEVPATATLAADGLSWHLVPTSPLGLGAHNLVVKVKLADDKYSTSPTLAQETYHVTVAAPLTHPATFGGDTSGSVTEDAATNTVNGTLTVSDTDDGEAGFQTPTSLSGTYGSFTFDSSTGKWTYTLDNTKAATQALTSTDSKPETLTVKSTDGTEQVITVTVHGANEATSSAPLVAADDSSSVQKLDLSQSGYLPTSATDLGKGDLSLLKAEDIRAKTGGRFLPADLDWHVSALKADGAGGYLTWLSVIDDAYVKAVQIKLTSDAITGIVSAQAVQAKYTDKANGLDFDFNSGGDTGVISTASDSNGYGVTGLTLKGITPYSTTDTTPILSGTLDAALGGTQVLRVFDTSTTEPTDLGLAAVTTTDGKTTWSLTVADAKALSQGTHTLVAKVMSSDAADAIVLTAGGSTTVKVIDLSITPSLTTVTDDVATQGSASGDVAVSDFKGTDDTTPTLSGNYAGTLADGQVIQILDGINVIGTATPGTASGGVTPWTFTPTTPLAVGTHSLKARVSVNGIAGTASEAATFTVQSVDRARVATDDGSSVTQADLVVSDYLPSTKTLLGHGDLSLLLSGNISGKVAGSNPGFYKDRTYDIVSTPVLQKDGSYTVVLDTSEFNWYSTKPYVELRFSRDESGDVHVEQIGQGFRGTNVARLADEVGVTSLTLKGITPYTTTDTTPVLSGTLGTALADGQVVKVFDTSGGKTTELGQATVTTTDGKTTWSLTLGSALSGGEHTIVAKVMSSADTSATVVAAGSGTALWIKSPATFGGDTSGSVTEDAATNTVNGTLTVSDTDDGEAGFQTPTSLSGTYGSFTFDNGKWTYTLDNAKAATQALTSTDSKPETLTVKSTDGTEQVITVTVHGADEASAPVIPPPPVIDTTVPAWISASPYVVASTKEAFKALTPQQQGMASLISDDVIAAGGEPTPANQSSWLGMNDDGTRKTWQSGDAPLTLTYAFQNSGASYTTTAGEQQTQQSFDEPEKSFISSVFKRFADVVNVQFTDITDSATSQNYKAEGGGGADLRMFKGTKGEYGVGDTTMGFAYLPTSEDAQHPADKLADSVGDFFLVTDSAAYPQTNPFSSAYGVEKSTVTHELGHAMGLNHPFANDAYTSHWYGDTTGIAANRLGDMTGGSYDAVTTDAPQETIMTYLSPFGDLTPSLFDATTPGYEPIATERYAPIDLGVYDIAALQHLYGANMSHATGNDVYKYSSDTPVFATIWDAGGHDTLQQEGSQDAVIDLRGGDHMSRMGLFTSYSATFSKSALESALGGAISDWYGVYTDGDGQEHRVGHVTHTGDAYTYYADPSMPANTPVAIKVDYSQDGGSTTLSEGIGDLFNVGVPDASMAYNIGIAFGVVIENAIGGSGNDVIWGNAAANNITTGAGKDVVEYDTAANINGDTILDFSADDKINLTALGLSSTDSLNWDSVKHELSYVDTNPANSWALTIKGVFDMNSAQLVIHA